jgi:hypothetical protein
MTDEIGKRTKLLAGAAGLVMVLAGGAAVASPPAAAGVISRTGVSRTGAAPAGRAHQAFLVTGQQVATGPAGLSVRPGGPAAAGQLQELRLGGRTYVLPVMAAAYLSRGLDPSLFEVGALARAESGGRLPVRVSYAGAAPSLPGVTITSASSGTARGYLTLAGARVFGAALERQFAGDHADAAYGQDGLFGNGVSVALAGAPATPRAVPARPSYLMHTLTVRGTTLSGRPDTGDLVTLIDADNASRFWTFGQDTEPFYHGIAKFSVPAGHFWVIGTFNDLRGTQYLGARLVLPPEITVSRNAAVRLAERAADSRVQFLTPRLAVVYSSIFERDYLTDRAPRDPNSCCTESDDYITQGLRGPAPYLYVSPMAIRPRVGTLAQITSAQLDSPSAAHGIPYQYYVAYQARGRIPAQRFVVRPADLATERAGFYAAAASRGYLSNFESLPVQDGFSTAVLWPGRFPLRLTMYLSAARRLSWTTIYTPWARVLNFIGGQGAPPQAFRPGQRLTDGWGAYPQHPVATVRLAGQTGPAGASATRAGNVLGLAMTAFGDNTPGHIGQYIGAPFTVTGRYQLDQDGRKIAGGALRRFHGFAGVTARLRPARSRIRFVLSATQPAALSPLSTASQTAWTWWSARAAHGTLPRGWVCTVQDNRACAAQPLLTLRYSVAGEAVTGAVRPGRQVIRLAVGHVQPARATRITRAAMSVSFNGGRTWHAARITGRGGRYTAAFRAPAGVRVTLRTSAADAAGGAVTQTIARAYRITAASGAPRAACPPAGPRRARCFTLYAPQTAASATRPGGWGAPAIESAYHLPTGLGAGQTVALVDAYSTPHLARDLGVYRREYGLPPCTTASGCLRIVNQRGQASPLPAADPAGWGVEETLDASMVSAACPRCKIIVVEARDPLLTNLAAAEDTAARLGAPVISNSYGGRESGFTQAEAGAYRHRGHVIVASSGDFGFTAANFPANLADVTAVGGTQLARAGDARGWTESVYNSNGASGSGCSAYVAKPPWQHDLHCAGRTVADVAALASRVAVYDSSITRPMGGPWLTVYGTSAAAPIVAGVYALAGNATTIGPGYEYGHAAALFDVTKGNNDWFQGTGGAVCGHDYLCVAKPGYDGPTGLGTPDGTGAF